MERVRLAVYDLSNGLAAQLSPLLLGKNLEAIYHSAVLLRGEEIYFGAGISRVRDGQSRFGNNRLRVIELGETNKTREEVDGFLQRAAASSFSSTSYNLLKRNCNHFSDEFATFLTGKEGCMPREIVSLPQEVLNSPFGDALRPLLAGIEASVLAVREGGEGEGAAAAAAPSSAAPVAAALEAAAGRAAVADARGREARAEAPATAALPTLGEQERAVAADVAAASAAAAVTPAAAAAAAVAAPAAPSAERLRAEFEALVRAEFDAVRSASPALSANEAAAVALERAAAAVRGKA